MASRWRISSFIHLKNDTFDVITDYLRFADKDFFQRKREHFHKGRLQLPDLREDLFLSAPHGESEKLSSPLHRQNVQRSFQSSVHLLRQYTLDLMEIPFQIFQIF